MDIFLIRHTRVNVKQNICYGQSDVGLADTFIEEAQKIKKQLQGVSFNKVYSSPLARCKKLSEFLFENEVIYDNRLMELNFGDWEMQEWDKIKDPVFNQWMNDFVNIPCTNGESFKDLHNRVLSFLNEINHTKQHKIAIICHGGVIRSFLAHIKQEDLGRSFEKEIKYGEICQASTL